MTKEEFRNLLRKEIYSICVKLENTQRIMESLDISSYENDYVESPEDDYQIDMECFSNNYIDDKLSLNILFDILENINDYDYEKISEEDYRKNYETKQELYFKDFKKTK